MNDHFQSFETITDDFEKNHLKIFVKIGDFLMTQPFSKGWNHMTRDPAGRKFGIKMFAKTKATILCQKCDWGGLRQNLKSSFTKNNSFKTPPSDEKSKILKFLFFFNIHTIYIFDLNPSNIVPRLFFKNRIFGISRPKHVESKNWMSESEKQTFWRENLIIDLENDLIKVVRFLKAELLCEWQKLLIFVTQNGTHY